MATKKKDLEKLRSNYEASIKAYEEAKNERIAEFSKLLFGDEELKKMVLEMKPAELKANAKMWADSLKKSSPADTQQVQKRASKKGANQHEKL